jgi:hypothetical protein
VATLETRRIIHDRENLAWRDARSEGGPISVRRFAGPDADKAVYYPEDKEYLLELEPAVAHYDVVAQAQP